MFTEAHKEMASMPHLERELLRSLTVCVAALTVFFALRRIDKAARVGRVVLNLNNLLFFSFTPTHGVVFFSYVVFNDNCICISHSLLTICNKYFLNLNLINYLDLAHEIIDLRDMSSTGIILLFARKRVNSRQPR